MLNRSGHTHRYRRFALILTNQHARLAEVCDWLHLHTAGLAPATLVPVSLAHTKQFKKGHILPEIGWFYPKIPEIRSKSQTRRKGNVEVAWTLEEVGRLYWRLTEIESTFRSMKSDLGMRPIYHSKDAHIEAHLFVTVLTYYMVQIARFKLKKQGIHQS
ncbi:MAG: hypothetical protein F4Z76_06060 [Rhodothermaceae bacterium]|nr:hypothetical protein [Rhodothermaceae bacterium]